MERTPGRARAAALVAFTLAVPMALSAAAPAAADHRHSHKHKASKSFVYDALGDSYAAGYGTAPPTDACARSDLAHPHALDGRMRIRLDDFVACSGAVADPAQPNSLTPQVQALDRRTDLVTLSIGGNDVQWIEAIIVCLLNDAPACEGAVARSEALVTGTLPGLLDTAYDQVEDAAPRAHVVVTGYPRLFSPRYGDYTGTTTVDLGTGPITLPFEISVAEQKMLNDAADLLNSTIRSAAHRHDFEYVDVTRRFKDHGVNARRAWIGGVEDPEQFHPTAQGQHAYGAALRAAVTPRDLR